MNLLSTLAADVCNQSMIAYGTGRYSSQHLHRCGGQIILPRLTQGQHQDIEKVQKKRRVQKSDQCSGQPGRQGY